MSKYSKAMPKSKEKLIELLKGMYEYVNEKDHVLDVGCSTGYFGSLMIEDKKCVVDGIEIDKEDAKEARKVLRQVFEFDLDNKWPPDVFENKYDVIFFGDVLEHLKTPEKALEQSRPLLKKGGRILISIPNIAHLSVRLELLNGNFVYTPTGHLDNTHLKYFTYDSLSRMLTKTGYQIKLIDYSLADFSPDLTDKWLKKVGLKATDKFWRLAKSPEARAYQFKIVAIPSSKPVQSIKVPLKPFDDFGRYVGELNDSWKKVKDLESRIEKAEIERDNLNTQLENLYNSVSWKVTKPLRKVRSYTRRK